MGFRRATPRKKPSFAKGGGTCCLASVPAGGHWSEAFQPLVRQILPLLDTVFTALVMHRDDEGRQKVNLSLSRWPSVRGRKKNKVHCHRNQIGDLPAMKKAARTIMEKADDILRSITSGLSNGLLEAINANVQAPKRKAKGYRTKRNLKTIVYLIAGGVLDQLPT